MTSIPAAVRRPSDAEWAAHLPRICELYYGQRYTLEDTQRVIHQESGFYATLRMYKDRIRNMAVHPKKICMQKYQAMSIVAEDFQRRGTSVHFIGPSGFQIFKRTPAQITRQLRRPHCLQPITLEQAKDVLQQSSIQAIVEHAVVGPASDDHVPAVPFPESTSSAPGPPHQFAEHHLSQIPSTSNGLAGDAPQGLSGPNGPRNAPPSVAWNYPQVTTALPRPGPPSRQASREDAPRLPAYAPAPASRPDSLSLAGVKLVPERLQQPMVVGDDKDSYDFNADFDALSLDNSSTPTQGPLMTPTASRMLPPPSERQRRRMATECAAPFFLACFPPANVPESFAFSRTAAMERFRYILTANPENQYVLPLLNWMTTVLASNDKANLLKDFVFECCQVLDTCRDYGFPLSTPFRYMLAFCNDDKTGMEFHGSHFAHGTDRLIQLYGPDHPNILVNEYYRAWHALMRPNEWSNARTILEKCLTLSEKAMGPRNLMTINCLVVLGRGFAENGYHEQAHSIFEDVLVRFDDPARPLQAYRLLIVDRLATEEERLGYLVPAERHRREVYEGRLRLLSAFSPETKAAMCSLNDVLRHMGHEDEAQRVQRHYDLEFETLWRREAMLNNQPQSLSSASSAQDSPQLSPPASSRL